MTKLQLLLWFYIVAERNRSKVLYTPNLFNTWSLQSLIYFSSKLIISERKNFISNCCKSCSTGNNKLQLINKIAKKSTFFSSKESGKTTERCKTAAFWRTFSRNYFLKIFQSKYGGNLLHFDAFFQINIFDDIFAKTKWEN